MQFLKGQKKKTPENPAYARCDTPPRRPYNVNAYAVPAFTLSMRSPSYDSICWDCQKICGDAVHIRHAVVTLTRISIHCTLHGTGSGNHGKTNIGTRTDYMTIEIQGFHETV